MKKITYFLLISLLSLTVTYGADWTKPGLTDKYTNWPAQLNGRLNELATQFSGASPTGQPTGTIRWNDSGKKWEKWTGSTWVDLADTYGINAASSAAGPWGKDATQGFANLSTCLAATSTVGQKIVIPSGTTMTINNKTVSGNRTLVNYGRINVGIGKTLAFAADSSYDGDNGLIGTTGSVTGLKTAKPEWFAVGGASAFAAAVNSLADGGTCQLALASYVSPYQSGNPLTKNNIRIIGTKAPTFNSDYTALENGTIIKGTFSMAAHYIEVANVGVDVGTALGGPAADAFAIYDNGSGSPWRGFRATNLVALCQSPSVAYHAALFENLDGAVLRNIQTVYGTHGIVYKGVNGTATGLYALGHASNGVIIKSSVSGSGGPAGFSNISDIHIGSTTGTNGGGLRLTAQEGVALSNINIDSVVINSTSYGIQLASTASDYIETVHINNASIAVTGGIGFEIVGRTRRVQVSNSSFNTNSGNGVVTSGYARDTDFTNVTASNNLNGFVMFGTHDSLLGCKGIDNTQYGFYTKTDSGATTYTDLCSGSGNGTALFGHDSTGKFLSNYVITTYAPTLQNSWVIHNDTTNSIPQYWKDSSGRVWLQGLVKNGTVGQPILTLPADFRPAKAMRFPCSANGVFGEIVVGADGGVALVAGNNAYVSLDSVNFMP